MLIYLLHLETAIAGRTHYMGSCEDKELDTRMRRHQTGGGSRFTTEAHRRGIGFHLAGLWKAPDRTLERKMKARRNHKHQCAICHQAADVAPLFTNVLYFAPVEPLERFALLSFPQHASLTSH